MSELLSELKSNESSNSMPVRDAEFFLYTSFDELQSVSMKEKLRIPSVAVNIGASGIDGIISSATGFAEGSSSPTTLLIGGDLATLHDLNVFHNLSQRSRHRDSPVPQKTNNPPLSLSLTSIIVNNDGGGIFSFLPIAKHGNDVSFETFFGTPTNSFSFGKGAEVFGLPFDNASQYETFKTKYRKSLFLEEPSILEAQVVDRNQNVQVRALITMLTNEVNTTIVSSPREEDAMLLHESRLPTIKIQFV